MKENYWYASQMLLAKQQKPNLKLPYAWFYLNHIPNITKLLGREEASGCQGLGRGSESLPDPVSGGD